MIRIPAILVAPSFLQPCENNITLLLLKSLFLTITIYNMCSLVFLPSAPLRATMSDDEHHDVHFESADAGASKTFPMQAGSIRKNGYIRIKVEPSTN